MTMKYCIPCEEEVFVFDDNHGHLTCQGDDVCSGPFASCPPPELPEDWELDAVPPSPAELIEMDASADELLGEFGEVSQKKQRKFRFLGYGDLLPCPDNLTHFEMDKSKYHWFTTGEFTVGEIYVTDEVTHYRLSDLPDDARFVDDDGTMQWEELQFFEEIFE